jgi:high-affinity iron transporter
MKALWQSLQRRWPLYAFGLLVALLVWSALDAHGGVPDPTDSSAQLSHGAVVVDSGLLVFREGLETILVLAAVTASMVGANAVYRRPTGAGAGAGFAATLLTWFVAVWAIGQLGGGGLALQAATGLLAVIVLLVVMNWFFHRVYWTGWISNHHRRRRRILDRAGIDPKRATILGLILLGFTSVYREGFEVVLFLQNLRLAYGAAAVLEGAALGLALTAAVGVLTFLAHRHLNYKRMLVLTGILLGVVLIVMVGESVQEMQLAGWLPTTEIPLSIPGWVGLWFAVFPTAEGLVAQLLAAALVIGSYYGAEYLKVRRPRASGERAARRPDAAPRWEPAQRPAISVETTAS